MSFERTIQMENHIILPVFGQFDANIKKIEKACGVSIVNRGDDVKISGEEKDVHKAWNILHSLVALVKKGEEITEYCSGEEFFSQNNTDTYKRFSVFFLDIQMKEMSGLDVAKKLRKEGYTGPIIFLTAFREYVFHGYEVHALNYLLKPVKEEPLFVTAFLVWFSYDETLEKDEITHTRLSSTSSYLILLSVLLYLLFCFK